MVHCRLDHMWDDKERVVLLEIGRVGCGVAFTAGLQEILTPLKANNDNIKLK